MEAAVRKMLGAYGRENYLLELIPERQGLQGEPSRNKGTRRCHFPPPPASINTQPPQYVTCLHQALPGQQICPSQLSLPQFGLHRSPPPEDWCKSCQTKTLNSVFHRSLVLEAAMVAADPIEGCTLLKLLSLPT